MRIIVCCDGTAKSAYKPQPTTNVARIARCIFLGSDDASRQVVLYQAGVGTSTENSTFSNLRKHAFGIGVRDKIVEAYSFICHNYRTADDKIILLGFSRGAFVMRCVADMIQKVGLLTKRGLYRLPMVSKEWLAGHEMPLNRPWAPETFPLATHAGAVPEADRTIREALEEEHSIVKHDVRVTALALWDTVSSMGIPWPALLRQPTSTSLTFVGSDLRGVDYAFQALALHESRWNFPAVVLRQPSDTNMHLQQCWFAGYHADVGGGRMQDALGHIALAWIFGKLRHYNILDFDESLFWTPLFNGPSFKIDRSTNRLVVNIKSSMSKPYRFLGSKHRIPRCQFWDNLGRPVEVNPTQDSAKTDTSHEEIHALVRPLLQEKRIPRPPALQDTNIPSRGGAWTIKGDDGRNFEVKQAPMSYFEASILVDWLGKELIKMQMDASIPFQIEEECRLLAEEIQHVLLED